MIIRPEKDFASTEDEMLTFFKKLNTNYKSYVSIPDGGHAIMLEKGHNHFQNIVLHFLH